MAQYGGNNNSKGEIKCQETHLISTHKNKSLAAGNGSDQTKPRQRQRQQHHSSNTTSSSNSNIIGSWNNFQAKAYMHWTKVERKGGYEVYTLVFEQVRSKY